MKLTPVRLFVGSLAFSAAGYGALVAREGYTDTAVIPVKNDRPTVGFGSTFTETGAPVKMGDKITAPKAIARSLAHIAKDEVGIKRCIHVPLSQVEYDKLVDFTYQFGPAVTCKSGMVKHYNAGNYAQACEVYPQYKYSGGYDCSTPGNKICSDVYQRGLDRRDACRAAL